MNNELKREQKYSMILLAGGKSSRMGSNKAQLTYQGKTFVDNLIEKAKCLGITDIFLSGLESLEEDVQTVWDIYPERGPLGGIHACMKAMQTPYALVLPVDVPQIPLELLEELFYRHDNFSVEEKKFPFLVKHGERKENLMGIYPAEIFDFIENRISEHSASVHGMLEDFGVIWYETDTPDWQLENINTQENYRQLLSMK